MKGEKRWRIQVFDSLSVIHETTVSRSRITCTQLDALIRTLAAKHSLDDDEIIRCYLKRPRRKDTGEPHPGRPLDVQWSTSGVLTATCGENPHVLVTAIDEDGCPEKLP